MDLDWDSPDDPRNPHNWSNGKRIYHTLCVAAYAFAVTYMSSTYAPGATIAAQDLGISETVSLLGVSLFCVGLSFGPIIGAPLSETFGRLVVYRFSMPLAVLFLVGSALSPTMTGIAICRFFAGLFGSPALSVGGGSVADLWPPAKSGQPAMLFVMSPFLGPCIAPVIGGFIVERKGWRWLEWVSVFFGVAACLFSIGMKETYKKAILGKKKGLVVSVEEKEKKKPLETVHRWVRESMLRPVQILFGEPIVLFLSLYIGFDFAVLYAFFASLPLVFEQVYHFNAHKVGLVFIALGLGSILSTITSIACDQFIYQRKARKALLGTSLPPEERLYAAMLGSLGVATGLFWFAWTARPDVHWIVPVLALVPFNWGNLCIFSTAMIYLIDCYGPRYGASALSANGFMRYLFAAGFPLFTVQMYKALHINWATSLLGFVSVALAPIPWILYAFGPRIRSWSKLART